MVGWTSIYVISVFLFVDAAIIDRTELSSIFILKMQLQTRLVRQ